MRRVLNAGLTAALLLSTGCITRTAVVAPTGEGKAYVVSGYWLVSSSVYNCEVVDDEPICWKAELETID